MPVGCYKQMSTIKEGVNNEIALYLLSLLRNLPILNPFHLKNLPNQGTSLHIKLSSQEITFSLLRNTFLGEELSLLSYPRIYNMAVLYFIPLPDPKSSLQHSRFQVFISEKDFSIAQFFESPSFFFRESSILFFGSPIFYFFGVLYFIFRESSILFFRSLLFYFSGVLYFIFRESSIFRVPFH